MSNKERKPENVLGQVSLSRELLSQSKAFAKKNGLPWATWVRTLIIKEIERTKKDKSDDESEVSGHKQTPALPLSRRAGVSSFVSRKF